MEYLFDSPSPPSKKVPVQIENVLCPVCNKQLTHLSDVGRAAHTNKCCDMQENDQKLEKRKEEWNGTLDCPICGEPQPPGPNRAAHAKRCGRQNNINATRVFNLMETQSAVAKARKRKGLSHTKTEEPTIQSVVPKKSRRDMLMPKSVADEDIQIMTAMSASVAPKESCLASSITNSNFSKRNKANVLESSLKPAVPYVQDLEVKKCLVERLEALLPSVKSTYKSSQTIKDSSVGQPVMAASWSDNGLAWAEKMHRFENLGKCLAQLLNTSSFADVTIEIDRGRSTIKAHKAILACRCPTLLEDIVTDETGHVIIKLNQYRYSSVLSFFKFIYCADYYFDLDDQELIELAKRYKVNELCQLLRVSNDNSLSDKWTQQTTGSSFVLSENSKRDDSPSADLFDDDVDDILLTSRHSVNGEDEDSTSDSKSSSSGDTMVTVGTSIHNRSIPPMVISTSEKPIDTSGIIDGDDSSNVNVQVNFSPKALKKLAKTYYTPTGTVNDPILTPFPKQQTNVSTDVSSDNSLETVCEHVLYINISTPSATSLCNSADQSPVADVWDGWTNDDPMSLDSGANLTFEPEKEVPKNSLQMTPNTSKRLHENYLDSVKSENRVLARDLLFITGKDIIGSSSPRNDAGDDAIFKDIVHIDSNSHISSASNTVTPVVPSLHKGSLSQPNPSGYHIIKMTNVTPMPDYGTMPTPQIKNELDKFGLRPFGRKKAVKLLEEVHKVRHPIIEVPHNGEVEKDTSFSDESFEVVAEETLLEEDIEEVIGAKNAVGLKDAIWAWLRRPNNSDFYQSILMYEPISFEEFYRRVNEHKSGCQVPKTFLANFLDDQHVTFNYDLENKRNGKKKNRTHKSSSVAI